MLGYVKSPDPNRTNPDAHYRLYYSKRDRALVVICVQDFDYPDYDANCFVDYVGYTTEADAELALVEFLATVRLLAATPVPPITDSQFATWTTGNPPAFVDTSDWDDPDNG